MKEKIKIKNFIEKKLQKIVIALVFLITTKHLNLNSLNRYYIIYSVHPIQKNLKKE
jgi:hypothetical protein